MTNSLLSLSAGACAVCMACSSPATGSVASDASTDAPAATSSVSGIFNGQSFVSASSFSFVESDGSVDLVFSDKADVCAIVTAGKLRAGETLLQLLALEKTADGSYAPKLDPGDVKVASLDPTCHVAYATSATSNQQFSIQLTRMDAQGVEGSALVMFADGSHASGTFSAASCAQTLTQNFACQ
jgi:hypothetical protein